MVELGPDVARTLEPGQRLGEYVIEKRLAEGGFGAVYLATNTQLEGRKVIVKTMHASDAASQELLRREARQLVELRHPSVVQVITFGEGAGFLYLVMEYLDAPTLTHLHQAAGALGPFEVVRLAVRMSEALEAIHEAGVVHRDLKPDNIMVKLAKDRGRYVDWLKLIDFGLAHEAGRTDAIRAGTLAYVAPETLRDDGTPVTPATDLYSFGCIVFELLTTAAPYEGDSQVMAEGHVSGPVPRLRDHLAAVDPDLDELVFRLLQKDPAARPSSAAEVTKALMRIERNLSDGATGIRRLSEVLPKVAPVDPKRAEPTLRIERGPSTAQSIEAVRGQRRWPLVAGALLLLIVGLGWALLGPPEARPPEPPRVVEAPPQPQPPPQAVEPEPVALAPLAPTPSEPAVVAAVKPPPQKPPTKLVVERAPECAFDERFRAYARATLVDLRSLEGAGTPEFKRHEVVLGDALVDKDCRRANAALDQLRRLVGAPVE